MKSIIICYICNKPKKYSDSYAVKVKTYADKVQLDKDIFVRQDSENKVRACRTCVRRMGYKVKAGKSPIQKKK